MFARQTRSHFFAFALALLTTSGMLGAVDSLASHPVVDDPWMAQVPASATALNCPAQG